MSIELDGPLYLGSNSLQQQVDQNTEDITELQSDMSSIEGDIGSLDNLATSDKSSLVNAINETLSVLDPTQTSDYIKNSKGLESGEISDNASIYPWVEEMSHSTFDRSKFTVVGSPTITDDGIASGFSSSNYLTISQLLGSGSWRIKCGFKTSNDITSQQILFNNNGSSDGVRIGFVAGNSFRYVVRGANGNIVNYNIPISNFNTQTDYVAEIAFTGTQYICSLNNVVVETVNSTELVNDGNNWTIGKFSTNNLPFLGSIDLKQFSITVDGVEIFSGNKTGIDTIKPSDYQVVGAPTISADGVASGFSSSNYLTASRINISSANEVIIEAEVTVPSTAPESSVYMGGIFYCGVTGIVINFETTSFRIGAAMPSAYSYKYSQENRAYDGSTYIIQCICSNIQSAPKYYVRSRKITETSWHNSKQESQASIAGQTSAAIQLGKGVSNFSNPMSLGSLNLNGCKIYVDGNLVYQPCLKIPYTLSKTGSKIVDSIYRDRVTDMYEQFGYAPYYTLDTTNSNYTIPKGEVYGMVNKLVPTLVAPDYSKPVSLTYSNGLAMENDGWLEVQIQSSEATANPYVSINGSIICRTSVNSNGDLNRDTAMMVVRKGDVITSGGYSADTAIVLTYYPFKV